MEYSIGYRFSESEYGDVAAWCNRRQEGTIKSNGDGSYEIVAIEAPALTEQEKVERELRETNAWLSSHDYIGIKIATGRATVDEYASEIAEMKEKADRINELEAELASLNASTD